MVEGRPAVCIYGASSEAIPQSYKEAAYEVGRLLAKSGVALVSGGGRAGLMRCGIDGALSEGGVTIGILPLFMVEKEWQHPQLTKMISTDDMHSRKRTMARMSEAVIALPGGCGTLDELMEIITWRQLGLYGGRVVILNVDGYYDPLLEMLRRIVDQGFMRSKDGMIWEVATTAAEAVSLALAEPESE